MRACVRLLCLIALLSGFSSVAFAQDDGARAYVPLPENVKVFSLFGITINGNRAGDPATVLKNADLNIDMLIPMFSWSYEVGGKSALGFVVTPIGRINGEVQTTQGDVSLGTSGLGDLAFGTAITLIGSPPMSLKEYVAYKPSTSLGVLLKVFAPTGQYDSGEQISVGGNRWAFQAGLPFVAYFGNSLADPKLLTFDLMPSITVFTDNNDPFGARRSSQDYIFRVEGHIAKNLNAKTFVSLDALYINGGATQVDGVDSAGSQRAFALGASVNYVQGAHNSFRVTYGDSISRNVDGVDGNLWRVIWNYAF